MSGIVRANNSGQSGAVSNIETIDSDDYVDASIDNAHLADDAVDSDELAAGSVDAAHLAADVITGAKIADDAIDSEHYTDASIDNAHIADDAIDSEHYAAGSIDTAHIADNQVTAAKLADIARGSIIYGNASAATAELTKGGANEVLTSDGTDIAWAAASAGAVSHEGADTTEGTTTSTSAADLLAIGSLTIPAATMFSISYEGRSTAGDTQRGTTGLKVNSAVIHTPTNGGGSWFGNEINEINVGASFFHVMPRVTNYVRGYVGTFQSYSGSGVYRGGLHGGAMNTALVIEVVNDIVITGMNGSTSITTGADELHVYSWATS